MNTKLPLLGLIFLSFISVVHAWPFVADTWNTNHVYAGSYYVPSSPYSGWTYNAYMPNSGYPVLGGGRYYPYGYGSGSYAVPNYYYGTGYGYNTYVSPSYPGHYISGSYYGMPVHSALNITYADDDFYVSCTIYGCN
jgi:hypothetical protein